MSTPYSITAEQRDTLQPLIDIANSLFQNPDIHGSAQDTAGMGIIAQRLPSLYFKGFGNSNGYFDLTFHDASTGQGYVLAGSVQFATETIAICIKSTKVRGRFDLKRRPATNDAAWGVAA